MRLPSLGAALVAGLQLVSAIQLDVGSADSIRSSTSLIAYDLLSTYYVSNQTGAPPAFVGTLPGPYYWWLGGGMWGAFIDYWKYTGDTSYVASIQQALLAQKGPNNDYLMPEQVKATGNDDQAFWGLALLSALEYNFPQASTTDPTWLQLITNLWNTQAPRWDTTSCNGGFKWQFNDFNAGYNYKNAISNGCFFQLSSRLYRYTGNTTYRDWAERSWAWSTAIGLVSGQFEVFDGTDDTINCTQMNHIQWTYNNGVYLYGAANMYNMTGSSDWANRMEGLLRSARARFANGFENATDVLYEPQCEVSDTCNYDQTSFKGFLGRFLAKTTLLAPYTTSFVTPLLQTSARRAAQSCVGAPIANRACGSKWYVDGWDGSQGVGEQLSALEVIQGLLPVGDASAVPAVAQGVSTATQDPARTAVAIPVARSGGSGGSGGGSADGGNPPQGGASVLGIAGSVVVIAVAAVTGALLL